MNENNDPIASDDEPFRLAKELRDIRRIVTEHAVEWLEKWHDNFPT